jgi:hypothetical protein
VHEFLPSAGATQRKVARMSHDEAARYIPDYERALERIVAEVDIVVGHHANLSAIATATVARAEKRLSADGLGRQLEDWLSGLTTAE